MPKLKMIAPDDIDVVVPVGGVERIWLDGSFLSVVSSSHNDFEMAIGGGQRMAMKQSAELRFDMVLEQAECLVYNRGNAVLTLKLKVGGGAYIDRSMQLEQDLRIANLPDVQKVEMTNQPAVQQVQFAGGAAAKVDAAIAACDSYFNAQSNNGSIWIIPPWNNSRGAFVASVAHYQGGHAAALYTGTSLPSGFNTISAACRPICIMYSAQTPIGVFANFLLAPGQGLAGYANVGGTTSQFGCHYKLF